MRNLLHYASLLVPLTAACAPPSAETGAIDDASPAAFVCAPEVAGHQGPTTDGALAMANLDAQIEGRLELVERRPDDLEARRGLVGLLLSRAAFRGTYEDFDRAIEQAKAALAGHPAEPRAHELEAEVLTALHRFDEALEALSRAEALGLEVDARRDTIRIARGEDLEAVLLRRSAAAEAQPSFATLAARASAELALGHFARADASFLEALALYGDVSPFPVAWASFQRGVMWSEQADQSDLGCALYGAAIERLPGYVVANVHRAELERTGKISEAMARLEAVRLHTTNPEPTALLGEIRRDLGESDEAHQLVAIAKARYDELLASHRLAFADHGAEFFMGPGDDPPRALELALDNLENRHNDRAYQLAISAAETAGDPALACALAAEAGPDRASLVLEKLIAELACP